MHKTFIIGSIFNVLLQTKTAFLGPLKPCIGLVHSGSFYCFHNPSNNLFACVYIQRTFVESARNFDSREITLCGRKVWHVTVTSPCGDHAPSSIINSWLSRATYSPALAAE